MTLLAGCSAGALVPPTTSNPLTPTTTTRPAVPAVDVSATPVGWVPIDYGDAQVSMPASFSVFFPGWTRQCQQVALGAIYLGPQNRSSDCPATLPNLRPEATSVEVREGHQSGFQLAPGFVGNGLRLYALIGGTGHIAGYYSPALGVELVGGGPLAPQVFRTLTRSPRSVSLASGPAPLIPRGWHAVTFGGLTFDAPESWSVNQTAVTATDLGRACSMFGVTFTNKAVALSTDEQPYPASAASCSFLGSRQQPNDGVEVDAHPTSHFPVALTLSKHCLHLHNLTACPATTRAYSILFLRVSLPGRATPVLVSIGLAGNGIVARTILYSLRPA